ncbi:2-isopropylmalate synthase [uncultured Thiothrix sp.]|mgnify:CR=1 FL=1|uniref:2-isopropylmalate synthase n=1 Tax=uncultured Thiothrix sp. TaxID=223185 RepID=UPI0026381A16|nr:2-isopropylmalate synthase [uncultured Thiothrix sp.]
MLKQPATKYRAFPPISLPDRQWPSRTITQAPIWMSTDLRDGNQSLFEPMNSTQKLRLFQELCTIGFKEIEVGFPSASQTDFNFVRQLITEGHIPSDVTIEVLTQAREHLIRQTIESLSGVKRAIVHVYNATSPQFRDVVFSLSQAEVIDLAVQSVKLVKTLVAEHPETEWVLQYSPETFSMTELDFALAICNAVTDAWEATPSNKIILNLPATVEAATPNIYADQIEWMHRHLAKRDSIIISLHPHNDRGTAVAATELALMAGADRVEGCLFGHGERTGNVDLVTMALNLYTQGVDPELDFSNVNAVARLVEECTQLPVHPRHPYVGDLVFTAFSGSHQDAIKKGFAAQKPDAIWNVPYLPLDPADVGRTYDSVIRVNSQSGKGGIAYLMEHVHGIVMPRRLQIEFAAVVQQHMDASGQEMSSEDLWNIFNQHYLASTTPFAYQQHHLFEHGHAQGIRVLMNRQEEQHWITGEGNGPIDAFMHALAQVGIEVKVHSYEERSMSSSASAGNAKACAFVELAQVGQSTMTYGVGIDENIITASLKAIISSLNRLGDGVVANYQKAA